MKKLIILGWILLSCSIVFASMGGPIGIQISGGGTPAPAGGDYCSTASCVVEETFGGSALCASGYQSVCDNTGVWTVSFGTPVFSAGNAQLYAYTDAATTEASVTWTEVTSTDYDFFFKMALVNLPAVATDKLFLRVRGANNSSNIAQVYFSNVAGSIYIKVALTGGSTASSVATISEGQTLRLWGTDHVSTGTDGTLTLGFTVDGSTTRPTVGNNYISTSGGTNTNTMDAVDFYVEYSSGGQCSDVDVKNVIVDDATIGDNPLNE